MPGRHEVANQKLGKIFFFWVGGRRRRGLWVYAMSGDLVGQRSRARKTVAICGGAAPDFRTDAHDRRTTTPFTRYRDQRSGRPGNRAPLTWNAKGGGGGLGHPSSSAPARKDHGPRSLQLRSEARARDHPRESADDASSWRGRPAFGGPSARRALCGGPPSVSSNECAKACGRRRGRRGPVVRDPRLLVHCSEPGCDGA